MVCKDEVVEWFQKLNGAGRLDTMCILMDLCLPFEIRFLGTVMENLGRRDFHELSHASHRANGFLSPRTAIISKAALCAALMDAVVPNPIASPSITNVSGGTPTNVHTTSSTPTTGIDSVIPTSRPSSVPLTETGHRKSSGMSTSSSQHQNLSESPFLALRTQDDTKVDTGCKSSILQNPIDHQEDKSEKSVLLDDTLRRRLIMYLSLLTATNRECANVYYKVLSDVQPLLETAGWLEGLDDLVLEEMALLFTIGSNHPAFAFEQKNHLCEISAKFIAHLDEVQNKVEPVKVFAPMQSFIGGFPDPKFGPYYMYIAPPVQAVQWPSPGGGGSMIGGTNGNVDDGNRLQSPVTFTVPQFAPFPMFVQTHPRSQVMQHPQVPHQFSQNMPMQTAVSPQSQMGIPNQSHPSPLVPHAYQQNPQVGNVPSHTQIHLQNPTHPTHSYTPTINGAVQIPVVAPIHPQMQPIGMSNMHGMPSVVSQFHNKSSSIPQSQLSPQPPPSGMTRASTMGSGTGMAFPSQSNSVDGYESEEYYESTEDSPYGSPPQSLTPSRSQSPTPGTQLNVVVSQHHNFVNTQPVVSHLSHEMSSHGNSLPQTVFNSPSQRSVCSSATSISPPPRTQRTSGSQKVSQNIQVQSRILPKNAQNIDGSVQFQNNPSSPFPGVPVSTSSVNCVAKPPNCIVTTSNMNGIKSATSDRRGLSKVNLTNHMNSSTISPITTSVVSLNAGVMAPATMVVTSATYTISGPNLVNACANSVQRESSRRPAPSNRRQPSSNQTSMQQMHHAVSSSPSVYNIHSQKSTNVQSSPINPPQYGFFPLPIVSSQQSYLPQQPLAQKGSSATIIGSNHVTVGKINASQASLNGGKVIPSNEIVSSGSSQLISTNSSSTHNGMKVPANDCAPTMNVPGSISSNMLLSTTPALQLPTNSANVASNQSRNRIILEVGGVGQELRIDPSPPFFGSVEDIVDSMNRPKLSCYNCGSHTHNGPDCNEKTMEEMTRNIYRINFQPETSSETKDKE